MGHHYIILLGGTPATGKSSVGRHLAEILECSFVEVSKLARQVTKLESDPTGRFTYYLNDSQLNLLAQHLLRIAHKMRCLIAATTYPEALIAQLDEAVPVIVILRTHPIVLQRRLESRGWPRVKVLENLIAEASNYYAEVLWDRSDMVVEIDTTQTGPEEASRTIIENLEQWKVGFHIDWLTDDRVIDMLAKWIRELDLHKNRLAY